MQFLDDIKIGDRYAVGQHTFSAEAIKSFAARFDPQPFHLDEEAAKKSNFGALCASGWQTAAVWMPLMLAFHARADDERRARGETVTPLGPSPGLRDLKWLKPVYAGDTISYVTEVIDKRESASRPGWGLFTIKTTGTNQHGADVISFVSTGFVQSRAGAKP